MTTDSNHIVRRAVFASTVAFMALVFDSSAVSVAAPAIRTSFQGALSEIQWVAGVYVLALSASLLSAGRLADQLGPRRSLKLGMIGFVLASLACGLAPNIELLIVSRFFQGLCGALMGVSTYALLSRSITDEAARRQAIGFLSASGSIALAGGPILSSFVVEWLSWRWIFYANIAIGAFVLVNLRGLSNAHDADRRRLDLPGQLFGVIMLGSLAAVLTQGNEWGWTSGKSLAGIAITALALFAFVVIERSTREPMIQLSLFRDGLFVAANLAGAAWRYALWGLVFFLGLYFHDVRHYSGLLLGAAYLPLTAVQVPASALAGRFASRYGSVVVSAFGMGLASVGAFTLVVVGVDFSYLWIGVALALIAFGGGLSAPLQAHVAMLHVGESNSGLAAGMYNSCAQTGALVGLASLGSLAGRGGVDGLHVAAMLSGAFLLIGSLAMLPYLSADGRH